MIFKLCNVRAYRALKHDHPIDPGYAIPHYLHANNFTIRVETLVSTPSED